MAGPAVLWRQDSAAALLGPWEEVPPEHPEGPHPACWVVSEHGAPGPLGLPGEVGSGLQRLKWAGAELLDGAGRALLTVSRQVKDQVDHEGDEHAGDQNVDDVEEGLAADDEVEGDILVAGAVQRDTGVQVDPGWPVNDLPLPVLCGWHVDGVGGAEGTEGLRAGGGAGAE